MKISVSTPTMNLRNNAHGYGHACQKMIKSLNNLGHEVKIQDSTAKFQINFSQPPMCKFHKGQYQIVYVPWESTEIPNDWKRNLELADEIWTTSDWCKQVFEDAGYTNVSVYAHGIDPIWKPKRRNRSDVLRFLHVGEPSIRKGGQLVTDAFASLFANNPKYQLTLKAAGSTNTRVFGGVVDHPTLEPEDMIATGFGWSFAASRDPKHHIDMNAKILGSPDKIYNNIKVIGETLSEEALVNLYYQHDVLVYPTYGEGFGFIPLQALATGMPTISTFDWAHYKDYLGPLKLKSQIVDSQWDLVHPGKVFEPNYQHLLERMKEADENFQAYSGYYYAQSTKIHEDYNWDQLTNNAFKKVIEKFS